MLGDTGVAVHPDDERYCALVGKTVTLPLMDREIPIIADEYVDREFGTGCVKMTPCHDPNDFDVGQRHGLEQVLVIDESAKIINGGKYNGLDRYDARREVLADLEALGLVFKTEDHSMNLGLCYRCNTAVEPVTSMQWFVKMKPFAKDSIEVVKDGTTKFVPERFSKIYTHWMENVRDWCISRQLWWGHRIPAWYCNCGHVTVSRDDPDKCAKCGSAEITRDEDVLDTWFSSALWPFSTLGWPDKTDDLSYFYPTDVLVTGYDIIFFWVARMIFSGMEHMKQAPFHTVFINGIIRDSEGRKMSKSLGNGIDPIDMIEKYGADALRFNIITGNTPGNDSRFYPERCEAMRNFSNKIWNASRFVMMNLTIGEDESEVLRQNGVKPQTTESMALPVGLPSRLELEDKWILSKLNTLAGEVCDNLDKFEIGVAAAKIYDFIWDSYCDWYIELTKPRLSAAQGAEQGSGARGQGAEDEGCDAVNAQKVLLYVLTEFLTMLHPFMPFITEEIFQALPIHHGSGDAGAEALMVRRYPVFTESLSFPKEEADFESVMEAVRAVRARRAEMNVPPSKKPSLTIVTDRLDVFDAGRVYLGRLAYASELTITDQAPDDLSGLVTVVTGDARLYIPLAELVDVAKERERMGTEITKAKADIERVEQKLANEQFTSKAPEHVIKTERDKLDKLRALLDNLNESLAALS